MNPVPRDPGVRRRMENQRRRDTGPELAVRQVLHRRGLRYRIDVPPLVGMRSRADIVFRPAAVAVFVDGCFWHSCPDHGTLPKTNQEWWQEKLETNRARDRRTDERLEAAGWTVIRIWEHEEPEAAADRVESVVRSRRSTRAVDQDESASQHAKRDRKPQRHG